MWNITILKRLFLGQISTGVYGKMEILDIFSIITKNLLQQFCWFFDIICALIGCFIKANKKWGSRSYFFHNLSINGIFFGSKYQCDIYSASLAKTCRNSYALNCPRMQVISQTPAYTYVNTAVLLVVLFRKDTCRPTYDNFNDL